MVESSGSNTTTNTKNILHYLREAFDTVAQGVVIYDHALKLVVWNPAYSQMEIMPEYQLRVGADIFDFYSTLAKAGAFGSGDQQRLATAQIESIAQGVKIKTDLMNVPATGKTVRIRRFLLSDHSVCFVFNDVTEEIRIEAQLRQTQKMDAIGKLTGGVAHDINNVLAVVSGSLELALDKITDPDAQQLLQTAINASARGAKLTQRLLAFVRQQALSPETVELQGLLGELLDMLQKMLGDNIAVELDMAADLWCCEIDRHQLESVLVNLVINARDAILPNVGTIRIQAGNVDMNNRPDNAIPAQPGNYVYIALSDDGCGIDPASQERVFEPFFTTKAVGQGTGLGLSMAHGFIEQSGGHITLSSELNRGTTVTLYLPAIVNQTVSHSSSDIVSGCTAVVQQTILLVESDDELRTWAVAHLEALGYQVLSATNGSEAIKLLRSKTVIHLLLTAMTMSDDLSGDELFRIAKTLREDLPVIFMANDVECAALQNCRAKNDAVFLQRPLDKQALATELQTILKAEKVLKDRDRLDRL